MIPEQDLPPPRTAPYLARSVLVLVLCGFCLAEVENAAGSTGVLGLVAVAVAAVVLLFMQLCVIERIPFSPVPPLTGRGVAAPLVLLGQATLVYLPLLVTQGVRPVLAVFLAGTALLLLPRRFGLPVFVAVVASAGVGDLLLAGVSRDWVAAGLVSATVAVGGLVVYALMLLRRAVEDHQRKRWELERLIAAEERTRLSRDVHDLLGLSLSAISLKTELTLKLLEDDPQRAADELRGVLRLTREGMADVRSVAVGSRALSLDQELRHAERTLRDTGLDVGVHVGALELTAETSAVFAVALREGATNVLRHSDAVHCDIVLARCDRTARLTITNDGLRLGGQVRADQVDTRFSGQGIRNITCRAEALGGQVSTMIDDDRHVLEVVIPLTATSRPEHPDRGTLTATS